MNSEPVCSVLVANYNGADVVLDCLHSVATQEFDLPYEIIVYDDASTDDSLNLVRTHYPGVRCIAGAVNAGFCAANNRMAGQAAGRYLLLLNNDATLAPDALRTLFEFAAAGHEADILTLPQYDMTTDELLDVGRKVDFALNPVPLRRLRTREVAMGIGACLWVPRPVWQELGGFPEWLGSIGEDLYLCLLAWRAGHRVIAVGRSGYRHRVGHSFGGGKPDEHGKLRTPESRRALSELNRTRVLAMLLPTPLLAIWLSLHLLLLALEGALLCVLLARPRLWSNIYWPALISPWTDRARLAAERRRLRPLARVPFLRLLRQISPVPYKLRMLVRHGLPDVTRRY